MNNRDDTAGRTGAAAHALNDGRLLIESVTDYAIYMLDLEGHVATWNQGAARIKGYTAKEVAGRHFSLFYTEEDRASGKPARVLDTARRDGRYAEEGWRLRKDGTRFWASVVLTLLRDPSGEPIGFSKVTRDLTERRIAQDALRQSVERLRLLIEGVTDYAIYMLDPQGRVTTWNTGAERLKGYRADEIIGQDFATFFQDGDRAAGLPARELGIARDQGRYADEGWRVRKDGTPFWASVTLSALRSSQGELLGFAKVTRDLTERREAEEMEKVLLVERTLREAAELSEARIRSSEQLARAAAERAERAAQDAADANRLKDEFLATVSHELRTPLNAIMGWTSLLLEEEANDAVVRGLEVISRNASAQAKIIEDILDVSRISSGQLRLELGATNLIANTNDAIEAIRPSAAAKEITVRFEHAMERAMIVGDATRLRQAIGNLLSNATKFTDRGGEIVVSIELRASRYAVVVRDSGSGIDPAFLPHVFERFRQADGSTTRRYSGLGLGLAIVRRIVELHGGTVVAESAGVGHGSTFTITVPVTAVAAETSMETSGGAGLGESDAPRIHLEGLRVLVVDDDIDARELLQQLLVAAGAEVATADSSEAGFEQVRLFRPQVLVSDISMPNEDGYSFMNRVRALAVAEGGAIPSIALTAYTRSEDRTRALASGFTTHIGKPVSPRDLVAAVANLAALSRR